MHLQAVTVALGGDLSELAGAGQASVARSVGAVPNPLQFQPAAPGLASIQLKSVEVESSK